MPIKLYKIAKGPPKTPHQRRITRDKQRAGQADKLYLTHARVLVPAALLLLAGSLLSFPLNLLLASWIPPLRSTAEAVTLADMPTTLAQLLGRPDLAGWVAFVVSLAISALLGPITLLGFRGLCLKAWRGRRLAFKDIFTFCRGGRWPRAVLFCLAYEVATNLPEWLLQLAQALWSPLSFLALPVALVSGWLTLRLMPATFLYLLEPERFQSPLLALKEGFALSSGEFWGLFLYQMRLFLRSLIGLIPLAVVLVPLAMLPALAPARFLLAIAGLLTLAAFASPFIYTGMAGHMDSWLPSDSQVRKKS